MNSPIPVSQCCWCVVDPGQTESWREHCIGHSVTKCDNMRKFLGQVCQVKEIDFKSQGPEWWRLKACYRRHQWTGIEFNLYYSSCMRTAWWKWQDHQEPAFASAPGNCNFSRMHDPDLCCFEEYKTQETCDWRPSDWVHDNFWTHILDPCVPIWTHLDLLRPNWPIWTHLVPLGKVWTNLDLFGPILTYLDPLGQILLHLEQFKTVWTNLDAIFLSQEVAWLFWPRGCMIFLSWEVACLFLSREVAWFFPVLRGFMIFLSWEVA